MVRVLLILSVMPQLTVNHDRNQDMAVQCKEAIAMLTPMEI
jgi:hypothetical protein